MLKRFASAKWTGGLKGGKGAVSANSGAFSDLAYTFSTRFEDNPGTNPEELVAAAHAACYSMALSAGLEGEGFAPESVETKANLTLEKTDAGWTTTSIHLEVRAKVPGADDASFQQAAEGAKKGCPISRLLNTKITLSATLV